PEASVKYTSALISDARNKLGGDVFARNRAGLYVRVKVKPKNPKTTSQQANRANFATYAKAFRSLTAAQILGWNTLASSSTLTDTLGNSYAPSGLQLYISCNRNLTLLGLSSISNAPKVRPAFPVVLAAGSAIEYPSGSVWQVLVSCSTAALAVPGQLQLQVALPKSRSINFVGASQYRNWGIYTSTIYYYVFWNSNASRGLVYPTSGQNIW